MAWRQIDGIWCRDGVKRMAQFYPQPQSTITTEKVIIKKGDPLPPAVLSFAREHSPERVAGSVATVDITIPVFYWGDEFVGFVAGSAWVPVRAAPPSAPPPPSAPAPAKIIPFVQTIEVRPRVYFPGTYAQYLADPRFRKIAAQARKDWGYRCLINADHRGPVEMHHRSYVDVPFREDWRTLIPLCEECHERYHGRLPKPARGLFDEPDQIQRAA